MAQKEQPVTQEDFDTLLNMGVINADGTLNRDGQEVVFGPRLPIQDIKYVVVADDYIPLDPE